MPDEEKLSGNLSGFERSLAALVPAAARLNRDQVMFEAGRASVSTLARAPRWSRWVWPATSFASTSAAIVLAFVVALRPGHPTDSGNRADRAAPNPATASRGIVERSGGATARNGSVATEDGEVSFDDFQRGGLVLTPDLAALRPHSLDSLDDSAGALERQTGTYLQEMRFYLIQNSTSL